MADIHEYPLYNFDHGLTAPVTIRIAPFDIEIRGEHCENLGKLRRNERTRLAFSQDAGHYVEKIGGQNGFYEITAIAKIGEADLRPSLLYSEIAENDIVDDLCATLSFLTGRYVFLEDQKQHYPPTAYFDGAVSPGFFKNRTVDISRLSVISEMGLNAAFLNIISASSARDLLAISFYANCSFNAVYETWCARNNQTKFGYGKEIGKVSNSAREFIAKELAENGVIPSVINDLVARFRLDPSPSAISKMVSFLLGNGLATNPDDEEFKKRIKFFNVVRNQVMHKGDVPSSKDIPRDRMAEIGCEIAFIIISMLQWYFSEKVFGLTDVRVASDERNVKEFFSTGMFRDRNIFSESYEDYMNRLCTEWMSQNEHFGM